MVKPAARKEVVVHLKQYHQLSERRSCWLAGVSRSGFRYLRKERNDAALIKRMTELATSLPRAGCPMLHGLLKQEGLVINIKRTERIYNELGLQVRTKQRKKLTRPRQPLAWPIAKDIRWSMDFVSDQLSHGRRFRVLNVVDDYSREMIGQLVAHSITGNQVARFLNQLIEQRSKPDQIVCDNGPEFTCKAMFFWQKEAAVRLAFIQPGKPTQNAFVESLNGKFRNECLNQYWFRTLEEAETEIACWRQFYNHVRPHSSLGYRPPVAFARKAA